MADPRGLSWVPSSPSPFWGLACNHCLECFVSRAVGPGTGQWKPAEGFIRVVPSPLSPWRFGAAGCSADVLVLSPMHFLAWNLQGDSRHPFSYWQPSHEPANSWLGSWTLIESLCPNRESEGVQSCSGAPSCFFKTYMTEDLFKGPSERLETLGQSGRFCQGK